MGWDGVLWMVSGRAGGWVDWALWMVGEWVGRWDGM